MKRARHGPVAIVAPALLCVSLLCGCGAAGHGARAAAAGSRPGGFAIGLTEDNAALLWNPQAALSPADAAVSLAGGGAGGPLQLAREEITALHPAYVRLLVDWAALQPDPRHPPALEAPVSGCARTIGPCFPYGGIRDELAAVASQQAAARASGRGAFEVVIDIFGTPAWAARPASGCEASGAGTFSRAPSAAGLIAYRQLIHALAALGEREGVALRWWAPWNEPNDPAFLSPQRAACDGAAAARAPAAYAELARAMAAQLAVEGGERHLLLGELNGFESGSPDRVSIAQFVAALPGDVVCSSEEWSLHSYATWGPGAAVLDPVGSLETALDARGGCARAARIWVTEAGAGARHPGQPRPPGMIEAQAGCLSLARQLLAWSRDPRVTAVLQYSFRDDPAFPVGLADARLDRLYPAYVLWLAWQHSRESGAAVPPASAACAA